MTTGFGTKIYHPELSNLLNPTIGKQCVIHAPVWIGDVKIGDRCKIQAFVFIPTGVTIGNDVFIGPSVTFTNDKNPPSNGEGWTETFVENGVRIGAGAVILPGLTIGENAVIGAGSVVTKDVLPNTIVVGNPAKLLDN